MRIINTIRLFACPEFKGGMHHEDSFGDLLKIIWHDGVGASLYTKRLERGKFTWPAAKDGVISISAGQLGFLLEAIDWRNPQYTFRPELAG